jgi:hypothetical protein
MSFLGRIAARASAPPSAVSAARTTPGVAQPAMASTSPLVAHDQRLTLPGFAEIAPGSPAAGGTIGESGASEAVSEGEPADAQSAGASVADRGGVAEVPIFSPIGGRERLGLSSDVPSVVARGASSVAGSAEVVPSRGSLRPDVSSASARDEAFARSSTSSGLTASLEPLSPARSSASSEREAVRGAEPTLPITVRDVAVSPEPAAGESRAELGPPPRAVLDAVARLDKWLRADTGDGGTPTPGDARSAKLDATTPATLAPSMAVAPQTEAAESASFAAAPVISIGRLEIEVVPPAPKARQAESRASERRARSVSRAPSAPAVSAPRSFGWRQR